MYVKIDSMFSAVLWILAFCAIYCAMPHGSASASSVDRPTAAVAETIDAAE